MKRFTFFLAAAYGLSFLFAGACTFDDSEDQTHSTDLEEPIDTEGSGIDGRDTDPNTPKEDSDQGEVRPSTDVSGSLTWTFEGSGPITRIAESPAGDILALFHSGLYELVGDTWKRISPGYDRDIFSPVSNLMEIMWAADPEDVYVGGEWCDYFTDSWYCLHGGARMIGFDGDTWAMGDYGYQEIREAWIAPTGEVFAVGNDNRFMMRSPGGLWETHGTDFGLGDLTGVSGTSSNNVWLSGGHFDVRNDEGTPHWIEVDETFLHITSSLLHWNGKSLKRVELPGEGGDPGEPRYVPQSVVAYSETDVVISAKVFNPDRINEKFPSKTTYTYDGYAFLSQTSGGWEIVPSVDHPLGFLWEIVAHDGTHFGLNVKGRSIVERRQGQWVPLMTLDNWEEITAFYVVDRQNVYLARHREDDLAPRTWIEHFDGSRWSVVVDETKTPQWRHLWVDAKGRIHGARNTGRVVVMDGSSRKVFQVGTSEDSGEFWFSGNAEGKAVITSSTGHVSFWDGDVWSRELRPIRPCSGISGIWGRSAKNLYVGCYDGRISHFNGRRWKWAQWDSETRGLFDIIGIEDKGICVTGGRRLENDFVQFAECQLDDGSRISQEFETYSKLFLDEDGDTVSVAGAEGIWSLRGDHWEMMATVPTSIYPTSLASTSWGDYYYGCKERPSTSGMKWWVGICRDSGGDFSKFETDAEMWLAWSDKEGDIVLLAGSTNEYQDGYIELITEN